MVGLCVARIKVNQEGGCWTLKYNTLLRLPRGKKSGISYTLIMCFIRFGIGGTKNVRGRSKGPKCRPEIMQPEEDLAHARLNPPDRVQSTLVSRSGPTSLA